MSKRISTTRTTTTVRPTLKSVQSDIDGLRGEVSELTHAVGALVAHLLGEQPRAVAAPIVKGEVVSVVDTPAKGKKGKGKKAKAQAEVRCLVQANRLDFIADHEWAQPHTTTNRLAEQVLLEGQPLTGNWMIGPKRAALVLGVSEADLTATHDTPLATQVVVAEVKADKPAKRTKAQRKAAKKIAAAPRRADGTITPKMEWALRQELAKTGYDAATIDAKVEAAYDQPPLAEHFGLSR